MERFRRGRTYARVSSSAKVTTIVDQGNQVVGSHSKLTKLASRTSTCSNIVTSEENRFSFESGRSRTELSIGTTMKKLLADEMSRETESGRRSPSIIARLMGLDGLPAAHYNSSKKQKRVSDNHQRSTGAVGFSKSSKLHDSRSHRKNVMGQQQFKDVYEVVDRSNMETRCNSSHAVSSHNASEDDIGYIRQKFMEVKRFSTDENLQHSKEYHDALEVLDSNRDLLLKFLQEPDSLFSKHLHDLHVATESSYGCTRGMNNNALKCNFDVIGCQTSGEASQKIDIIHSHKRWTSCPSNMYHRCATNFHKLSFSAEESEDVSSVPTKIVVLKPNLGKTLNIKSASLTSPCEPQSDDSSNLKHLGPEVRDKKSKHDDFDIYGRNSRESKELAREITRRMRNKLGVESFTVSSSGYKGYSADESSHDTSEDDSSYESEMTFVSSRTSSNRTLRSKASTSRNLESSVNMEAKKRLSERWRMTHRCQELGASSKGSTLAEMLAIPDVDIRPRSPDIAVANDECFRRIGRNDGTAELVTPLGISSRDGWKNGCMQNLSRSRSLPASNNYLGNPRSNTKREAVAGERFPIRKESTGHVRMRAPKEFKRKEASFSERQKASDEKSQSSCPGSVKMVDDMHEVQSTGNMMENLDDGKESPDIKAVILEMPSYKHVTQVVFDTEENKELRDADEEVPPLQDGPSTRDMPSLEQVGDVSCLQCAATHLESSASTKESGQPSPVSVLEAPFVEDLSSGSECFERVSADLHGLRMQLQMLKLESEGYDEGLMLVSGDEYTEESTELFDGKHIPQDGESWESWYLVDVLTLSGLDKTEYELFFETWHSQDCPIGHWVFEDLEKRYGELESCSGSERRLLFDHINSRIVEISQQFVDRQVWVKSPRRHIGPQQLKEVLKTEVHKLLEKHENKGSANSMDTMILSDMQWMMLGEHISSVGRDIEALLIDELVGLVAESLLV